MAAVLLLSAMELFAQIGWFLSAGRTFALRQGLACFVQYSR
jgi:hypothetical protein